MSTASRIVGLDIYFPASIIMPMKSYESMILIDVNLGEDGARNVSNAIKDKITELKGKIIDSNFWGKRKLAYEIKHTKEGFYEVIKFEMDPKNTPKFNSGLKLMGGLVRYLVTAV